MVDRLAVNLVPEMLVGGPQLDALDGLALEHVLPVESDLPVHRCVMDPLVELVME